MNISTNIRKMANIFILLFLALSVALIYWQVLVPQQVTSNIHNSRNGLPAPIRGNIFDRNGVLLAYSVPNSNVAGGYTRVYTDPSLAGLIGYYVPGYPSTGIEHQYDDVLSGRAGATELSNTINSILHRPAVGSDIYLTVDERIQQIVNKHFDDATSQSQTQQSKRGSVIVTNPHTGEILAMLSRPYFDPNLMVQTLEGINTPTPPATSQDNLSYYNQLVADPDNPLLERPLNGLYAPGSTYKTLTLLAGLDSGSIKLTDTYDKQHAVGPITIDGQQIGPGGNNIDLPDANPPYTFHYPVDVEYGFVHSDNIIFAQIGVKTGFDTWMKYNGDFYVGQQTPFDLPVAVSQVLPQGQTTMADNELAADSFGQGTDFVTPFEMSLIDDAVANDGALVRPSLVLAETDHQNVTNPQNYQGIPAPGLSPVPAINPQTLSNPITQQTAQEVRQAMFGVMRCGSGSIVSQLFTSNVGIIGKTGTAQVGGAGTNPHGWMITQAPYSVNNPNQLPALTIVAMKENDGEGAFAVGPMIAHDYEDIFSNGYVQAQLPGPVASNYCTKTGLLQ